MSRLYASIDSDSRKTQATSRGHKYVNAHIRGWNSGVRIVAGIEGDEDTFAVILTSGSSPSAPDRLLGTVRGDTFTPNPLGPLGEEA